MPATNKPATKALPSPAISPHPARSILAARKLTVTQLADATGYSRDYISRVLNKDEPATDAFRARVSVALGLPEAALFDRAWCS